MRVWRQLRTRLVATYLLLALVLLGSAGVVFSKALSSYAEQVYAKQRTLAFNQVLPKVKGAGMPRPDELRQQLQTLLPGWQVSVEVVAGTAVPADKLQYLQEPPGFPVAKPVEVATGVPGLIKMLTSRKDDDSTFVNMATDSGGNIVAMRVTAAPSGAAILRTVYSQVLILLALALLLAGLVGWWLSRWITRPLKRLADATAAVAGGDFLQTVEPVGMAELDGLTAQFNAMVGHLRDSFRTLAAERDLARRFAADAAHELRTPVTAMRTYQEVWAEHPERAAQMLPSIGRQVQRLERVISGLLQLAALTEGSRVQMMTADLGAAVGALAPGLEALVEESGHQLTVSLPDVPARVSLDVRLLEQILYNLVDNACKYTPPGGRVEVAVSTVADGGTCLSVRDNGPGIDPGEVPHLFERFHRGIDTQSIPGTGLGLAIVQEAVNRLGGTVSVESVPGEGSCFRVCLPGIAD